MLKIAEGFYEYVFLKFLTIHGNYIYRLEKWQIDVIPLDYNLWLLIDAKNWIAIVYQRYIMFVIHLVTYVMSNPEIQNTSKIWNLYCTLVKKALSGILPFTRKLEK